MTDEEKIKQLKNALTAARFSLSWWAYHPAYSRKRHNKLQLELAKYDATLDEIEK